MFAATWKRAHQRHKTAGVGKERKGHSGEECPDDEPGASPTQAGGGAIAERTGNGIGDDRGEHADDGSNGQVRELMDRIEGGHLRGQQDLPDGQEAEPDDQIGQRQQPLEAATHGFHRHL